MIDGGGVGSPSSQVPDWRAHFDAQCVERNRRESKPFKDVIGRYAMLRLEVTSALSCALVAREECLNVKKDRDALASQLQELQLASTGVVLRSGREKELEDKLRLVEADYRKALLDRNEFLETQLNLGKASKTIEELNTANADLAKKVADLARDAKERESTFALVKNELSTLSAQNETLRKKQSQMQAEYDRCLQMVLDAKGREAELLNENLLLSEQLLGKGNTAGSPSATSDDPAAAASRLNQNMCFDTRELGGITLPPSRIIHRIDNAHDGECYAVAFAENSRSIWTGGNDKLIRQYDSNTAQLAGKINCSGAALCLDVSSGKLLAGCADSICRVWEVSTMRNVAQLTGHTEKVTSAFLSHSAAQSYSASSDRTIKMWDTQSSSTTTTIMCFSMCTDFCVANERICAVHMDGSLRMYDIRQGGKLSGEIKALHDKAATSVRMTPDGNYAVTLGRDNTVKLIDLRKLDTPIDSSAPEKLVISTAAARLAMSPDANLVACGSSNGGCVLVWSIAAKALNTPAVLEGGHTMCATSLSWSPDGRGLATLGQDKRLTIWR